MPNRARPAVAELLALLQALTVAAMLGCAAPEVMRPNPTLLGDGSPTASAVVGDGSACGPYTADTLMRCVSKTRLESDVKLIAEPRPPESEHHEKVRQLCRERLQGAGFQVELHAYGSGVNVVGSKPGFSKPDEQVIVSAHYDSIAKCEAADDNASGVAAVLEVARVLASARFDRTLVVACWDESERGQLGSAAYAKRARERGDKLEAAFVLESIAYASSEPDSQRVPEDLERIFPDQSLALLEDDYRADFLLIITDNSTLEPAIQLNHFAKSIDLDVSQLTLSARHKYDLEKHRRRDQASFWDQQQPALLLTDTGSYRNRRARCQDGADSPSTLDYDFAHKVVRATLGAVAATLQIR